MVSSRSVSLEAIAHLYQSPVDEGSLSPNLRKAVSIETVAVGLPFLFVIIQVVNSCCMYGRVPLNVMIIACQKKQEVDVCVWTFSFGSEHFQVSERSLDVCHL